MNAVVADIPVERLDEVDSTNLAARRWVERAGTERARVFVARRQTAGVGRFGRRWHSPEGGLWCSLAWGLHEGRGEVAEGLGLRVGIACWRTVSAFVERGDVRLKWPNDVLIDGKKACGCLAETIQREGVTWLIAGVGINIENDPGNLPGDLRSPPTAVNAYRTHPVDPEALLPELIARLQRAIEWRPAGDPAFFRAAGAAMLGVGERVTAVAPERRFAAVLRGLSDTGRIRVIEDGGEEVILREGSAIEYG